MANLTTNFNVNPYYDDYDEAKQFQRILFKPAVAIQARELTQLQTILQEQVARFGNNIYKEGTIIDGCKLTFDESFSYVKIADLQTNGQPVAPSTYVNYYAKGSTTGQIAQIEAYADGLVSQDPNATTLYINYIGANGASSSVFNNSETIEIHSTKHANDATPIATVTAAGASLTNAASAVGDAFAVYNTEGVIYAKGHFLKVAKGSVVASKYTSRPDNVSVGFDVKETIVNSSADSSLLDNASGYNNENAPGADRLKLNPYLVAIPTKRARANTDFLGLVEFQGGLPITKKFTTQFNSIAEELAIRTNEEAGSFTVKQNQFQFEAANSTHYRVAMSPGLHYINGYRAEQFNTTRIAAERATTFANTENVILTTNQGNYVNVKEFKGTFQANTIPTVSIRDTAGTSVTDGDALSVSPGSEIGTCKLRTIQKLDGGASAADAKYRFYIFDVKMNAGKNFARQAKAFHISNHGTADIVLTNSVAKIEEQRPLPLIWPLPNEAVKSTSNTSYTFRTVATASVTSSNTITLTSPTGAFPYSGSLTNDQKKDFIITANTTGANLTSGVPIWTDDISISVSGATATIDISGVTSSAPSTDFSIVFNASKVASAPLVKSYKTIYIKIDAANNSATNAGPWSLGVPDVQTIEGVFLGNTTAYDTSLANTNIKDNFELDTNAEDFYYGLSQLSLKPGQSVPASSKIIVKAKAFQSAAPASGVGFYTVSSYKESNGTTDLDPSDIPLYKNQGGIQVDLRDAVDARPQVANTGAYATTVGAATINPSSTEAFNGSDPFGPAPDKQFTTGLSFYMGRIDQIAITNGGYVTIKKGIPSLRPVPPTDLTNAMVLGDIAIPPYPSLTSEEAKTKKRINQSIKIKQRSNKRYTMADIGKIDRRLKNIEYYTTLNSLESQTESKAIVDSSGNDRFKNGIFVDAANDLRSSDVKNREFKIGIDPTSSEFIPKFKTFNVDLITANTSSNLRYRDGQWMFAAAEQLLMSQSVATNLRPATEVYYKYFGQLYLSPTQDAGYDVTNGGTKDVLVDNASMVEELFEGIEQVYPLTRTSTELIGSDTSSTSNTTIDSTTIPYWYDYGDYWYDGYYGYGYDGHYWGDYRHHRGYWGGSYTTETSTTVTTTSTTDTYLQTTQQLKLGEATESTEKMGDFITDVTFSPYMRAKAIKIKATGLKPYTDHYVFFDGQSVIDKVAFAKFPSVANTAAVMNKAGDCIRTGQIGVTKLTTGKEGTILAQFYLPANTFHVGDREMIIADVASYDNLDNAQSKASGMYHAYNYSVEKTEYTLTTRQPTITVDSTTDTFTNTYVVDVTSNSSISNTWAWNDHYWRDDWNGYFDYNGITIETANTEIANTDYGGYIDYSWDTDVTGNEINIVADYTDLLTTTGTGDIPAGAITGSSGGYIDSNNILDNKYLDTYDLIGLGRINI